MAASLAVLVSCLGVCEGALVGGLGVYSEWEVVCVIRAGARSLYNPLLSCVCLASATGAPLSVLLITAMLVASLSCQPAPVPSPKPPFLPLNAPPPPSCVARVVSDLSGWVLRGSWPDFLQCLGSQTL